VEKPTGFSGSFSKKGAGFARPFLQTLTGQK
jgi:hypothetical protein